MSQMLVAGFKEVLQQCQTQFPKTSRWIIGFSGGVDSTALLSLCAEHLPKSSLLAVYVDHQLQAASADWSEHCRQICGQLDVAFISVQADFNGSSEEAAREARYHCFASMLDETDMLLLAHQADDQAETFLFRLFRGAGVRGLSAIPRTRPLGRGNIYRPLLSFKRSDLEEYLSGQTLLWIEDPSNQDLGYTRNWIRHRLASCLSERWPNWIDLINQTRARIEETDSLNRDLAEIDLQGSLAQHPLPITALKQLAPERIKNSLYYWLREQHVAVASEKQIEDLTQRLVDAKSGCWQFGEAGLHLYQNQLYLDKRSGKALAEDVITVAEGDWDLGSGRLAIRFDESGLQGGLELKIRTRRAGDRVQIPSRGGSVSLKKLMNERSIPPWLRDSWPVLEYQGEIICVPNLWIDLNYQNKPGFVPRWCH